MIAAGLNNPLFPAEELSVMGAWELLPHLSRLRRRLRETAAAVKAAEPDVLVTIDSKGFAFRLVDMIRRNDNDNDNDNDPPFASASAGGPGHGPSHGPVCVHYVSPSWWAYNGGEARLKGLKSAGVDLVLCLLPFEPPALRAAGVPAEFVGHPVVEDLIDEEEAKVATVAADAVAAAAAADGRAGQKRRGSGAPPPVLALLPGSREQELRRHLPLMREACRLLARRNGNVTAPPGTRVVFLVLPQHVERIAAEAATWPLPAEVLPSSTAAERAAAFTASTAAVAATGTATAQLFAHDVPHLAVYRAHPITELVAYAMAKTRYASLPNIVLGRDVVPELLGWRSATPSAVATEAARLLRLGRGGEGRGDREEFISALTPDPPGTVPSVAAARAVLDAVYSRRRLVRRSPT